MNIHGYVYILATLVASWNLVHREEKIEMSGKRSYLHRRPEFQSVLPHFLHSVVWFQFPHTEFYIKSKHKKQWNNTRGKTRWVKGEFRHLSLTFTAVLLISQGKKIVEAIRDWAVFQHKFNPSTQIKREKGELEKKIQETLFFFFCFYKNI